MIKKAFTLAEVLIVIGIIGVVAALTLPNLNHATGDKETVTRLQKAYSILNEANDRAVAIYGPISTWESNQQCAEDLNICWTKRIGEFLKISKSCNETGDEEEGTYSSCDSLSKGDMDYDRIIYQLPDGITFSAQDHYGDFCKTEINGTMNDVCYNNLFIDINGPSKGKNQLGVDIFKFSVSDSLGVFAPKMYDDDIYNVSNCLYLKSDVCTWWIIDYGNLDYLKADTNGKCNDSNIVLDGTTNTSCH